jgi:cytosine/uracil/thiamine/allantoin permease
LTAGQACGVVVSQNRMAANGVLTITKVVGCTIASLSAFLNGGAGAIHHVGFGALARAAFGLWGSYFVITLSVFQSFIFYGTQVRC